MKNKTTKFGDIQYVRAPVGISKSLSADDFESRQILKMIIDVTRSFPPRNFSASFPEIWRHVLEHHGLSVLLVREKYLPVMGQEESRIACSCVILFLCDCLSFLHSNGYSGPLARSDENVAF